MVVIRFSLQLFSPHKYIMMLRSFTTFADVWDKILEVLPSATLIRLSLLTDCPDWFFVCTDLWPCSSYFAAASCRWGADAASRPCRQPDCHDAGHNGPEFVLLQRQADDREGPGPACALNRSTRSDCNKRMSQWEVERLEQGGGCCPPGQHSLKPCSHSCSHTVSRIPFTVGGYFRAAAGVSHTLSGVGGGLTCGHGQDWFCRLSGWVLTCCFPSGLTVSH